MRFQAVKLLSAVLVCGIAGLALAATSLRAVPAQSTFGFTASQAGAPVRGVFAKYNADIKFDPKDLAGSRFDVTIDLKSTSTKDKDRDTTLVGPDFFAADRFPNAHYVAEKFTDQGG